MPRTRDHERRPRPHHLVRLVEDHLDLARIALVAGELDGARRRLDVSEVHDSPLDLRDRLLSDDEDVAGLEPTGAVARIGEQACEVVSLFELWNAAEADHAHLAGRSGFVLIHHNVPVRGVSGDR